MTQRQSVKQTEEKRMTKNKNLLRITSVLFPFLWALYPYPNPFPVLGFLSQSYPEGRLRAKAFLYTLHIPEPYSIISTSCL